MKFYFKEQRKYLHGTTLFDYIINNHISKKYELSNIDFSINTATNKKCIITPTKEGQPSDKLIGQYKDSHNELYIFETDNTITERIPYDEISLVQKCIISNNTVNIPANINNYSFIEKVIASYKNLLASLYDEKYGKYLFARIMLDLIPEEAFLIKHERIISNRYFEGAIHQNNTKIGTIYFGIKKK